MLVGLLSAWLGTGTIVRADGGTVRFSQQRDGLRITVFTSPTPLRTGLADVSVWVQDAAGNTLLDLPVTIFAHPAGDSHRKIGGPATTETATNKLFRAADVMFTEPGCWRVKVEVQGLTGPVRIDFEVDVAKPLPSWVNLSVWIGWPAAAVLLFGIHQLLVRRRRERVR
jgi:hypothetical protein